MDKLVLNDLVKEKIIGFTLNNFYNVPTKVIADFLDLTVDQVRKRNKKIRDGLSDGKLTYELAGVKNYAEFESEFSNAMHKLGNPAPYQNSIVYSFDSGDGVYGAIEVLHNTTVDIYQLSTFNFRYVLGVPQIVHLPTTAKVEQRLVGIRTPVAVLEPTPEEVLQYIITTNSIVVVVNDVPETINKDHRIFAKLKVALDDKDYARVKQLINTKDTLEAFSQGQIKIDPKGTVWFNGKEVHSSLTDRMTNMFFDNDLKGLSAFTNFMEKCNENPSWSVITRLYDFLQANDIEIDMHGDIVAFKKVRYDYRDIHSNTMDNSVGNTLKMPRNEVEDNDAVTCASGLHVCSKSYLSHFSSSGSDKVLSVIVNPKNVVSIPTDYNNAKMRVCEYYVAADITDTFTG